MVVESVEKCPPSYEPYQFTLSEHYRKMAKEELGEDDAVREQSLAQLREWIAKHPYIRKCRTDARFLLRFLRQTKFSIPLAQQAIERYLVTRQRLAHWYQALDPRDAALRKITDDQVITILGKDSDGRTVLLARMGRFDVDNCTARDVFRYYYLLVEYLVEHDEAFQIAGLRAWIVQTGAPMKYFGLWGPREVKIAMEAGTKVMPFRFRGAVLAELPTAAMTLINAGLSMMGSELSSLVSVHSTVEESKKHFDGELWIKEFGGTLDLEDVRQSLSAKLEDARDQLLALDQMEIDLEHYSKAWNLEAEDGVGGGVAGSFRSLEID